MESEIRFLSFVICFESEKEARNADDERINVGHFEWSEWITKIDEDVDYAEDGGEDGFVQEKCAAAADVVDCLTAFKNR